VTFKLHSWLAPLQALALVMSPRLGLEQYPTFSTEGRRGELDKKHKHHENMQIKQKNNIDLYKTCLSASFLLGCCSHDLFLQIPFFGLNFRNK